MDNVQFYFKPSISLEQKEKYREEYYAIVKEHNIFFPTSIVGLTIPICFGGDGTLISAIKDLYTKRAWPTDYIAIIAVHHNENESIGYRCGKSLRNAIVSPKIIYFHPILIDNEVLVVNEITIRHKENKIIEIHHPWGSVRGDGINICTAFGSTAYNKSLGGPILESDNFCITPIAPYSGVKEPIVYKPRSFNLGIDKSWNIFIDGINYNSYFKDEIWISKSKAPVIVYS